MSQRNTLENKRLRRAERSTRKSPPGFIDLVQWVRMRSSVTKSEAVRIIMSGALKADSHTLGVKSLGKDGNFKVLDPIISAELRDRIQIVMPEGLSDEST